MQKQHEGSNSVALQQVPVEIADLEVCREWTAHHSKSFYMASCLLPRKVRHSAWVLYAFCRLADDTVDEGPVDDVTAMLRRVGTLRTALDRVYRGEGFANGPIERSFSQLVHSTKMPRQLPEQLLAGMEMDARAQVYDSVQLLYRYCFNVASVVGLMMVYTMEGGGSLAANRTLMLRASDLGLAMQLTNIARDIGEDAKRDRVYVPDEILQRHGIDRDHVLEAVAQGNKGDARIRSVVFELLKMADGHYLAADRGIEQLPFWCRPAIRSARLIYSAIGDKIKVVGFDSLNTRAFVTKFEKLLLVIRALFPLSTSSYETAGPEDSRLMPLLDETIYGATKSSCEEGGHFG